MTQCCFVPGGGKSAIVNGLPSGPTTYLILDRNGSNIKLSRTRVSGPVAGRMAVRYAVHSRTVSDRPTLRTQGFAAGA